MDKEAMRRDLNGGVRDFYGSVPKPDIPGMMAALQGDGDAGEPGRDKGAAPRDLDGGVRDFYGSVPNPDVPGMMTALKDDGGPGTDEPGKDSDG